jgi:predicted component of type VI protein secretion system
MSGFKGKVHWWDGLYLSPEHLQEENFYTEDSIKSLQNVFNNYITVNKLKINELLLTRGVLEIDEFEGMFGNLKYINYVNDSPTEICHMGEKNGKIYSINQQLNKFAKIINENGLIMYLNIDNEEIFLKETINNVVVEKKINKLILIPEFSVKDKDKSLPLCRIITSKGGFIIDETYIAPINSIKKNNNFFIKIEDFIKYLRMTTMETAGGFFIDINGTNMEGLLNKINYFFKYHSLMPEILVLESLLYGNHHPLYIFLSFQRIIGSLSLLRFTNLPPLQVYDHLDIYKSINNLMEIIKGMLDNLTTDGDGLQMKFSDNKFSVPVPIEAFTPLIKTYLLLEMEDENEKDNISNWIEEAAIYGEGYEEILIIKRVRGINRNILNKTLFGNKILVVELNIHSEFLKMNSNLYIYNNMSSYTPKSILLCWRSVEI